MDVCLRACARAVLMWLLAIVAALRAYGESSEEIAYRGLACILNLTHFNKDLKAAITRLFGEAGACAGECAGQELFRGMMGMMGCGAMGRLVFMGWMSWEKV